MRVCGIVPARLESSRLPGKLLLAETGRPLLQYAWEAASRAASLDEVVVATDSQQIADAVRQFGGRVELTGEHPSGTDRIAEVVRKQCERRPSEQWPDVVVNLQGDEPDLSPESVDVLVETLQTHRSAEMATLATPITNRDDLEASSCTKVVRAADGRALYFSRAAIPYCRDLDYDRVFQRGVAATEAGSPGDGKSEKAGRQSSGFTPIELPWLLHLGVYAYRRQFLLTLTEWPPSRLESLEKLEQLRALEGGATIQVAVVSQASVGIDTPEDYARFVARQAETG